MAQLEAAAVAEPVVIDTAAPATSQSTAEDMYKDDPVREPSPPIGEEPEAEQVETPEGDELAAEVLEEVVEPVEPAIAPPISWKAEAKEAFEQLPPALQKVVSEREAERERFVATKANETVKARDQYERDAVQAISQINARAAQQLQQFIGQPMPPQPDIRLLQTGIDEHRALYNQQEADFRVAAAQRGQAQQQAQHFQQQAEQQQAHLAAQTAEENRAVLAEKFPEFLDPSQNQTLVESLGAIGTELGYSPQRLAEADASDILALKYIAGLKSKADKYDAANKVRMEPVRAAKVLPPVMRAGTAGTRQAPKSVAGQLYPND